MSGRMKLLEKGNIVVSPSQIDTAETCLRKWWFERVIKLPTVQKDYLTFGTLFHSVAERWLAADRIGRVPIGPTDKKGKLKGGSLVGQTPGQPVELFPPGWTKLEERGRTYQIDTSEAALIKRLIAEAIEDGVVERYDDRTMEKSVQLPVMEGAELWGYIDVDVPDGVHDHKTYGPGGRNYLKRNGPHKNGEPVTITAPYVKGDGTSPNCVGHDRKMLTYAWDHLRRHGNDPVLVRHNQVPRFHDESVRPKTVEAWVSADRLAQHWAHVKSITSSMLPLHAEKDERQWRDIPGPRDSFEEDLNACAKYGGCAFRTICARTESPSTYRARVERVLARTAGKEAAVKTTTTTDRGNQMAGDIFAKHKAKTKGAQANAAKAAGVNGGAVAAATAEPEPAATNLEQAPWADPECKPCAGSGQNIKKGRFCVLCASTARQRGAPEQAWFNVEARVDKSLAWTVLPEHAEAYEAFLDGDEPATPTATGEEETTLDADDDTDSTPATSKPAAAETTAESQKSGGKGARSSSGRPKIGVQLRLGVNVVKGPNRKSMTIQDVLAQYGADLAESNKEANYYALDAFMRRDRLAQNAASIVEDLGTVIITGRASCPDTRALYSALVAACDDVQEGSDIG